MREIGDYHRGAIEERRLAQAAAEALRALAVDRKVDTHRTFKFFAVKSPWFSIYHFCCLEGNLSW